MWIFGERMRRAMEKDQAIVVPGRRNLMELLPDTFTLDDAKRVRRQQGNSNEGDLCIRMIRTWTNRGYVIQNTVSRRAI